MAFAAGIFFVVAASFAGLWWRARNSGRAAVADLAAAKRHHAQLTTALATLPVAGLRWPAEGGEEASFGGLPERGADLSLARFQTRLASGDSVRLAAAVAALRRAGIEFGAAVSTADGAVYQVDGRVAGAAGSLLWLTDMSAMRDAEAARAAAAAETAMLRAILDKLPIPVWRRDAALRIVACNAAYATALDVSQAAVLADSLELAPESARDRVRELARKAAAGTAQNGHCRIVIGGARRLVRLIEMPCGDRGTVGLALDETAVETAESELARHRDAYGRVLGMINAAVAIYGPGRRLIFFNEAFTRLWGVEEEWLAAGPAFEEVLERLRERRRVPEHADFLAYKRERLAMFASLIEPRSELMHLPDDRTLSLSVSPHPLGGLVFVYEDVTDRLALERSYNTLAAVQHETLDNLSEGIAVFGDDGRLKLHNPAFREIWAFSEADLAGGPHVAALVEKTRRFYDERADWPALRERIAARITGHEIWTGTRDRRDGSVVQLATTPLPDGNVLLTCLDVTDTARVARVLRERNEALEAAARLKSEFIASVSYELRTPLNTVIGFAELLTSQYFGPLSERQLEYSSGILDSSHRLMSLINDIIDLATIEAGYLTLEPGRIEVCDMLNAVAVLARERVRTRNLSLGVECPPAVGAIEADGRRLKQALFNLVTNAARYTPPGGAIRLEARLAEAGEGNAGDLVLAVADTGIGVPPADREWVESLDRGDPLGRDTGAGLGLSLVRSLIELHGGTVAVDSVPGSGTTVLCRLPARLRLPE